MKLKPGYVLCPKCEGKADTFCFKCLGKGQIDWIQYAMGYDLIENPYKAIELPLLRQMYPRLIAKDLVSVQPMEFPNEKEKTNR